MYERWSMTDKRLVSRESLRWEKKNEKEKWRGRRKQTNKQNKRRRMLAQALDLDDVEHGKQFNIFRLSNAATASIHVACRGPNAGGRIIIDKMPCSAS